MKCTSFHESYRHHKGVVQRLTLVFLMLMMSLPEGGVPMPLPWGAWGREHDPTLVPVVIIPGTGGNQMEARLNRTDVVADYCTKTSDWFRIWLNVWNKVVARKFTVSCFMA